MTTRYTQDEWLAIIKQAESNLPTALIEYKAPNVGTAAFAKTIDHTLLKLGATQRQIDTICDEASRHNFKVGKFARREGSIFRHPRSWAMSKEHMQD